MPLWGVWLFFPVCGLRDPLRSVSTLEPLSALLHVHVSPSVVGTTPSRLLGWDQGPNHGAHSHT
jgi:hypothetical protein